VTDSAAVRARAARIVAQVATFGRSLDGLLAPDARFSPQQWGLVRALSYDSIRWYLRLRPLLARLLTHPGQSLEPEVEALAIVGLCQLLHTQIPVHAAVAETVNAARVIGKSRAAPLLNAILRRCQREQSALTAEIDRDVGIRTAHPRWLVDALQEDWPSEFPDILAANNARPPFWIRVNRRRSSGVDYRRQLESFGMDVAISRFDDETLMLAQPREVAELPGFDAGLVSVQDAAAQLAARLVSPQPGQRILDACAAPGGKTCHLLELQPELRELIAVDVSRDRLQRLEDNLRRLGLHATVTVGDATAPDDWWDGRPFDRILLDVPCSATGVIRRHPDIKLLRRGDDIAALAERQLQLLRQVWPLLAKGGELTYASCSALRAETTQVIVDFLPGEAGAVDVTAARAAALDLATSAGGGIRIPPGASGMDGFYYACLKKI
jgi:16S rRNA (cytosine967-C5)-methyltransferase